MDAFDELVADEVLVGDGPDPQDDVEGDAGVGEAAVADDGLEGGHAPVGFAEDFAGDGDGDRFDVVEVTAVADADGDDDGAFGEGLGEVGDGGGGEFLVGDDDQGVDDPPQFRDPVFGMPICR